MENRLTRFRAVLLCGALICLPASQVHAQDSSDPALSPEEMDEAPVRSPDAVAPDPALSPEEMDEAPVRSPGAVAPDPALSPEEMAEPPVLEAN